MSFDRKFLVVFSLFLFPFFLSSNVGAIPAKHNGCVIKYANEPKDYSAEFLRQKAFGKIEPIISPETFGVTSFVPNARILKYDLQHRDNVLVLLIEFADEEGIGPLHNNLPQPIPEKNNTDYWVADFSKRHYENVMFNKTPGTVSMTNWYLEQSSGRYVVEGEVRGWYQVPFPEKHYGGDGAGPGGYDRANGPSWRIIEDVLAVIGDEIDWKKFDREDRYDWDKDGDVNEPDGYIDHLMIVHAGAGQEGGGGAQGDDAIWSHRSKANYLFFGGKDKVGPEKYRKHGGLKTGSSDDIWILDYTIQPEDGGVGVFAHEFAHDLEIPDLYNTRPMGKHAYPATAYWTVMSSGSWTGPKGGPIGTVPTHFGPWEKEQLGWLDYEEITIGGGPFEYLVQLDRVEHRGLKAQGLKINLPKDSEVFEVVAPEEGKITAYSQKGDELDNTLTAKIDLRNLPEAKLKFRTWFEIEQDWDYAYVEIEDENGTFQSIPGSLTTDTNPNGNNFGHGITGHSLGWIDAEFDLASHVGKIVNLRFRYVTDGAAIENGFVIDNVEVKVGDTVVVSDDFEGGLRSWKSNGFKKLVEGKYTKYYDRYYLLEWRTHFGFDRALSSIFRLKWTDDGSYPTFADFYPYDPGLVVWYRNGRYEVGDNHVDQHPGEGFILVVDAHPDSMVNSKDDVLSTSLQIQDAAFGLEETSTFTIMDRYREMITIGGNPPRSVFNDVKSYYRKDDPDNSVKLPQYGIRVAIDAVSFDKSAVQLRVSSDYE
ncbi:immune inhibitor A domain-containing protein [Bdellovibrionota bacterium]